MAQTLFSIPSTVLPSGNTTSANFTMPAGFQSVTTAFVVQAPDLTDASISLTFELWRETSPGSGVFVFDHGFTWTGNAISSKTGLPGSPSITVETGSLFDGLACQIRLALNKPLHTSILVTGS